MHSDLTKNFFMKHPSIHAWFMHACIWIMIWINACMHEFIACVKNWMHDAWWSECQHSCIERRHVCRDFMTSQSNNFYTKPSLLAMGIPELSTGHCSWTRPTRRNVDPTRPDPTRDCWQKVWPEPDPRHDPFPICIVFNNYLFIK